MALYLVSAILLFGVSAMLVLLSAAYRVLQSKKNALPPAQVASLLRELPPPPALPWLPLVGSLPFLSQLDQIHWCFMEKARRYGNVFSFYEGPKYVVVLNGYDAIREALFKRSTDYGGRGDAVIDNTVWNPEERGIVFKQFGEQLKRNRHDSLRVLKLFGYGVHSVMETRIQAEAEHLIEYLYSLDGASINPAHVMWLATLNVLFDLMFSERLELDSPTEIYIQKISDEIVKSVNVLFQVFPVLMYLPSVRRQVEGWKKDGAVWSAFLERKVTECLARTDGHNNFVREYKERSGGKAEFDRKELRMIIRDIVIAGSETTASQLTWGLVLLGNHPEVQARVQVELDSVVPSGRPPSLDDRASLPYTDAMLLELLRMRSVITLTSRLTTCDTQVAGYRVPANTGVMVNLWSAHMDPEVWTDPDKFRPERFLDVEGKVVNRDLIIAFSLGKRACLGKALAREELFLFLTGLLQKFDILPPESKTQIRDKMTFCSILKPAPFELRFVKRSNREMTA